MEHSREGLVPKPGRASGGSAWAPEEGVPCGLASFCSEHPSQCWSGGCWLGNTKLILNHFVGLIFFFNFINGVYSK